MVLKKLIQFLNKLKPLIFKPVAIGGLMYRNAIPIRIVQCLGMTLKEITISSSSTEMNSHMNSF